MMAEVFGVSSVTGETVFFENGWLTMLELSWGGAVLGCSGTGLVSGLGCGVEIGDCARVRSCREGTGVPRCGDALSFKGGSSVSMIAGGGGVGIVLIEVSLFEGSWVFMRGSSVVEIFGGGEIGISGGMAVNESIGGAGGAGSLMGGWLGTLNSGDDERTGISSCSL